MVAVSGGADSVALLRALCLLAERRRWRLDLHVAHVQHGLRAEASRDDEAFVRELAERWGLPFHRRAVAIDDPHRNVESQARRERYAALLAIAKDAGAMRVATAHHADDQLETLLLALLRGRSLQRMGAIRWHRPIEDGSTTALIRPLLSATRAEVIDFLKVLGQGWREDHTNADTGRARNRLRRDVTPVLRELNPEVARAAVDLSDRLRRDRE